MTDHPALSPQNSVEAAVLTHFQHQATACAALGSPFTARLCRELADTFDRNTQTGSRILGWGGDPREDALALRICGGLHALVLSGADETLSAVYPPNAADDALFRRALGEAISRHDERLVRALDSAPQTNEIARSSMLLPGFLAVARETGLPLALHEIGSSAALNLMFDRFHYRYGDIDWGDPASPVRLQPEVRGGVIPVVGAVKTLSHKGSDIAPLDIGDAADRLRLRSYVWADQRARLERLDAAMEVALASDFHLEKIDAAAFVRNGLAARPQGSAFMLFHSIMWQYLPGPTKAAIIDELERAGSGATLDAPVAWLRMEPLSTSDKHATLSLTIWPGGETRDLARCDYHGRWIEWIARP